MVGLVVVAICPIGIAAEPETDKDVQSALESGLTYSCQVVDKFTGQGIPDVRVKLRLWVGQWPDVTEVKEDIYTSDADGKYKLIITPELLAKPELKMSVGIEHDQYVAPFSYGGVVSFIRKQHSLGQSPNFERVELYPAEAVTGRVVDAADHPVVGVRVKSHSRIVIEMRNSSVQASTYTDEQGRFRLRLPIGSESEVAVIPKDYATMERSIGKKRGELEEFRLDRGIRVSGTVVDIDRRPLAGLPMNIEPPPPFSTANMIGPGYYRRSSVTDADGKFSFDPLTPGEYLVRVSNQEIDPLSQAIRRGITLPAAFVAKKVRLQVGASTEPLEIQAVPHVTVRIRTTDSQGNPVKSLSFTIRGNVDGQRWDVRSGAFPVGEFEARVPHGLERASVEVMSSSISGMKFRIRPDQPFQSDISNRIELGTLTDDVEELEIVKYAASPLIINVADESGIPVNEITVIAKYTNQMSEAARAAGRGPQFQVFIKNGGQFKTPQFTPGEEIHVIISARGYLASEEVLTLTEGETKEMQVTLRKAQ